MLVSYDFLANKKPTMHFNELCGKKRIAVMPRKSREIIRELIVPLEHLLGVRASWAFLVLLDFHLYAISDVE